MKPETVDYNKLSHTELIKLLINKEEAQYFNCECGIKTVKYHKARHLKTKKHKAFETEQEKNKAIDAEQDKVLLTKDRKPRFNKDVEDILRKQARQVKEQE
jgi:hypothetical protein